MSLHAELIARLRKEAAYVNRLVWADLLREAADALERADTDQRAAFLMAQELRDLLDDMHARWDMRHPSTNPGIRHHVGRAEDAYIRYQQSRTAGEKK